MSTVGEGCFALPCTSLAGGWDREGFGGIWWGGLNLNSEEVNVNLTKLYLRVYDMVEEVA